ncbi:MAG: response regulator [Ignavibacteriales bacterium]|nr:response regulator [Ignavibacteriales bacterium]
MKRMIDKSDRVKETHFFFNGKTAIDNLRLIAGEKDKLPDLIFLDLNMPVMDGWQFLDEFTALSDLFAKKIPIYIVSSSIAAEDILRAKSYEVVNEYIVKPVTKEMLINILEKL